LRLLHLGGKDCDLSATIDDFVMQMRGQHNEAFTIMLKDAVDLRVSKNAVGATNECVLPA
jgi:hypothetical protein